MVSYIFCNRWVTIDNQVVSNDKLIILISESYAPLLGIEQPLNISSIFSIESTLVDITEKNMHPLFSNFPQFEGKHRQFNLHRYYVLEFEQQTDIQSLAAQLIQLPEIISVEYNSQVGANFVPNDDNYPNQWAHDNQGQAVSYNGINVGLENCDMDTDLAWDITMGSENVIIAIIDSGVDLDHPEFEGKIVPGYDFVNNDEIAQDDYGHGTACAGVAAAIGNNSIGIAGVAWQSLIMPVKVLASDGYGDENDISDGIIWATENNANVISMSLGGGGYSSATNSAINYAVENGTVVFAASGNNNNDFNYYPSGYDNCISVGALSPCNERKNPDSCDGENFWGSNYGENLDFLAPGVRIHSTVWPWLYMSNFNGTSSACPHAAGVAALLLSVEPNLQAQDIRRIMQETAVDMGESGFDIYTGWGRVNAFNALNALNWETDSVILTNRLESDQTNLGGSLSLDNLLTPDIVEYPDIISNEEEMLDILIGPRYTATTFDPTFGVNNEYRHYHWDTHSEYLLEKSNFIFNPDQISLTALFKSTETITINSTYPDVVELHDPSYAYQQNGNWVQPDEFRSLSEQGDGQGNFNIFLNHNEEFNSTDPIYAVKTSPFFVTNNEIYQFDHWQISYTDINGNGNPDAGEYDAVVGDHPDHESEPWWKQVVFKAAGAIITAEYSLTPINEIPNSNIFVLEGNEFTIPSGESIIFAEEFQIIVFGEMIIDNANLTFGNNGSINVIGGLLSINNSNLGSIGGGNTWEGVVINNSIGSTISNTTIFGSNSSGLVIENSSEIVLTHLNIEDNNNLLDDPLSSPFEGLSPEEILQFDINEFLVNRVDQDGLGGGLAIINSQVICNNVHLLDNEASIFGGGLYIDHSNVFYEYGSIKDNTVHGMGGGLMLYNSDVTLSYSTIISNISDIMGGVLTAAINDYVEIEKCTIANNTSSQSQDISINSCDYTLIHNSIISDETIVLDLNSAHVVNYNDFYYSSINITPDATNFIDIDPEFVDALNGDYSLNAISLCIDTGDPDPIYYDVGDGTRADMGAFYYHQALSGDVNLDAVVNSHDIVLIVAHILDPIEYPLTENQNNNADVFDDDIINILDIVSLVDIILTGEIRNEQQQGTTYVTKIIKQVGTPPYVMDVLMLTDVEVAGMQMQIDIEQGYKAISVSEGAYATTAGMTLAYSISSDSSIVKYLYFGMNGESFPIGNGKILEIGLIYEGLPRNNFDSTAGTFSEILITSDGKSFNETHSVDMEEFIRMVEDADNQILGIPERYALHAAYPNPFNPITTFQYDIPEGGKVSLVVYDMLGREVTQLVNSYRDAGYHSIKWDASNVASGIYMARLVTGNFTAVQKIALVK